MEKALNHIHNRAYESEKSLESYLRGRIASAGGLCLKYYNSNEAGFPDRIILLPGGRCAWCELKSRGRYPSALQYQRIRCLRDLGFTVAVCDSRDDIEKFLREIL